jgi:Peptidyl-tRNA hydrolase PTH2
MCNPTENADTQLHLYLFVRKDLTKEQITVQSCHAAIEASRYYVTQDDIHPSLVILQVDNEEELEKITLLLSENGIKCKGFYEEFYGHSLTAIGTEMIGQEKRKALRGFPLLKFVD